MIFFGIEKTKIFKFFSTAGNIEKLNQQQPQRVNLDQPTFKQASSIITRKLGNNRS